MNGQKNGGKVVRHTGSGGGPLYFPVRVEPVWHYAHLARQDKKKILKNTMPPLNHLNYPFVSLITTPTVNEVYHFGPSLASHALDA
jgi:hypothetical protein